MSDRAKRILMATLVLYAGANSPLAVRADVRDPTYCEHYDADIKLLHPLADAHHYKEIFRLLSIGSVCGRAVEISLLHEHFDSRAPKELTVDLDKVNASDWQFTIESSLEMLVPSAHLHGKDVECLEILDTYTKMRREGKRKLPESSKSEIDRLLPLFIRYCSAGCAKHKGPSCDAIAVKSPKIEDADESGAK